jgi:enoyl-CoA hydratase/carnithine racemase
MEAAQVEPPFLLRTDDAGVVTLTLNRPQSRNALSLGMLQALRAALEQVDADTSARVIVLAGAGPAFCAGHDLKELRTRNYDPAYVDELFALCAEVMLAVVNLSKPVIARVQGVASAAGLQLVASADLAFAGTSARFATPGVNIGLFCSTPMVALSRNIGRKQAMELLLSGDLIEAETALRFGLVNEVLPPELLEARVMEWARKLASRSPLTLAIGKKAFYAQAEMSLAAAYEYTRDVMAKNLQAQDAREGIGAFVEKRQPSWTGC